MAMLGRLPGNVVQNLLGSSKLLGASLENPWRTPADIVVAVVEFLGTCLGGLLGEFSKESCTVLGGILSNAWGPGAFLRDYIGKSCKVLVHSWIFTGGMLGRLL